MGYVTYILYVKRKFRWIIFFTWVGLFPFSPHPTICNYSWTGLNRRQRKLSKVGLTKLNLFLPIIHDMYLFKKWFLRSSKWLFISILFSISPFIFSSKQNKGRAVGSMRQDEAVALSLFWPFLGGRNVSLRKYSLEKIGLVKIKPANIRWMNWGKKYFNEVNSFYVNCE